MNSRNAIKITFRGDDLALYGELPLSLRTFHYKKAHNFTRFLPCDYISILKVLNTEGVEYESDILIDFNLSNSLTANFVLRDYQAEAVQKWFESEGRGVIQLATGAGKTIIGLGIIQKLRKATLVLVPTLDLVFQWINSFTWFNEIPVNELRNYIGQNGGGVNEIKSITISTYESARIYSKKLRDKFGLIIFDEVHHLSGESWREIAKAYIAPYRLGLTATLDPNDESYKAITSLVGKVIFHLTPQNLRNRGAISYYKIKKVFVKLSPDLQKEYERNIKIFREYMRKRNLFGKEGYQRLIYRYRDPEARKALEAHRISRIIAFNADGKLGAIREIIRNHPEEKILLFCESIPFIERVSERFLIPVISSKTTSRERKQLLRSFKEDKIRIIGAGRVLDEGIDVAKASIGIIISGSAKKRQFIQRLGRVLRPHPEKRSAIMYEIITQNTSEELTADRRHFDNKHITS